MAFPSRPSSQSMPDPSIVGLPLRRKNYVLLAIGLGVIILGFLLMIGGKADNPQDFNPAIFNFQRITLAPMVVLAGFLFEIYAIMHRPRTKRQGEDQRAMA